jgi:peptidoglycan/xylan/chitin deacetylase (PgdA/CDA1 family)
MTTRTAAAPRAAAAQADPTEASARPRGIRPKRTLAGNASILVYPRFGAGDDEPDAVRAATFVAHVHALRALGYAIVPLRELVDAQRDPLVALPARAIALTVDGGSRSILDLLAPIVARERTPVTLFVHPQTVAHARDALGWAHLRRLRASGSFDVQAQTYWHPDWIAAHRHVSPSAFHACARTQFADTRTRIEQEIGAPVDLIAWPFGSGERAFDAAAIDAGYRAGLTYEPGKLERDVQRFALPRFTIVDACTPRVLARLLGAHARSRPQWNG